MNNHADSLQFWNIKQVMSRVGLSRTTLWREERAGRFPKRIMLTRNRVAWSAIEVVSWMAQKQSNAKINRSLPLGQRNVNRKNGGLVSDEECVLVCGETGITKVKRQREDRSKIGGRRHRIEDDLGFMKALKKSRARILLCPFHTAYRRYEIREKKRFYSRGNRLVVSTWNFDPTLKAQSKLQWCAFKNGIEITDQIRELPYQCKGRPDIKLGLLEV